MDYTTIPLSAITIPEGRQRQSFDETALVELAASIRARGLIHALVIDQDNRLVAGERRFRVIRDLIYPLGQTITYVGNPVLPGHVPVIRVVAASPLELEEIELAENLHRKDLTWQEQAEAHSRLHRLRLAQQEARRQTAAETGSREFADEVLRTPPVTPATIAREIYGEAFNNNAQETVRQELLVAGHLDKPEVAKAPTLKEAMKALKKIEDAGRNRALAELVGKTFTSDAHELRLGNCLELMAEPKYREKFDVILTDPPYGMGADRFGDAGGRLVQIDHQYDDSPEAWNALMTSWAALSYLVAKPQAHAYVFCDISNFFQLKSLMISAGWYVFRTPFTNYKRNSGRIPLPDRGPRRQSEWFLYAIKGNKKVNFIGSDVIESDSDENLTHGAQKPVQLYIDILRRSVQAGDAVLDSFGGTGTLIPAAHELKCSATVFEQNPEYYGICLKRLEGLDKQEELPL